MKTYSGWFGESQRHSLARRGVRTAYFASRRSRLLDEEIQKARKDLAEEGASPNSTIYSKQTRASALTAKELNDIHGFAMRDAVGGGPVWNNSLARRRELKRGVTHESSLHSPTVSIGESLDALEKNEFRRQFIEAERVYLPGPKYGGKRIGMSGNRAEKLNRKNREMRVKLEKENPEEFRRLQEEEALFSYQDEGQGI